MDNTFGFIGFGKMAGAIYNGIVNSGFIKPELIYAYDPNTEAIKGPNSCSSIKELVSRVSTVLIATKPFIVNDIINEIQALVDDKLVISILAGIETKTYEEKLTKARIVRVMPNTPAMVNEGMAAVSGGKLAAKEDVEFVRELFSKLGEAVILDETLLNAVTAVSGSGPAFYYYIIDKIAKAGVELGLDYKIALKLSAQTALGASKMILKTNAEPEKLIEAVTTPNGTTAEGNKVLIESDIEKVLMETINKTYIRSVQMGHNE